MGGGLPDIIVGVGDPLTTEVVSGDLTLHTDVLVPMETLPLHVPYDIGATDDPSAHKVCRLIDLNLFLSSSDSFRHNMGGYFVADATGSLDFSVFEYYSPKSPYVAKAATINADLNLPLDLNSSEYVPLVANGAFVCSVKGDPGEIKDDLMWKTLWKGGIHGEKEYRPFINLGTYEDHYLLLNRPYAQIDRELLNNPSTVQSYVKVSYDYQYYLPDYQNYASNIQTELSLPNWYMMKHAGFPEYVSSSSDLSTIMYNFLSLDEKIVDPWYYFESGESGFPPLSSGESTMRQYLDMVSTGSLTSATQHNIAQKHKNIFFNHNFYRDYDTYALEITGAFPYYTNISFEKETPALFSSYIKSCGFDTRLLRILKSTFLNQQANLQPKEVQYAKQLTYLTSSQTDSINTEAISYSNVQYRIVDLIDLLVYSYDKIHCDYEDFTIVDSKNLATEATYDTRAVYRTANAASTLKMLHFYESAIEMYNSINTISGLLNGQPQDQFLSDSQEYTAEPGPKYNEVVAYRIEKKGILTPGSPEETLQNFWFINTDRTNAFQFFDSQVKYDKDYTYKIYSYNVVVGLKYKYSNLQLSRIIGEVKEGDPEVITGYCVEYYDPDTDQAVTDLAGTGSYATYSGPEISRYATDSQRIISAPEGEGTKPYRAQFVVTVQPDIQITEIPLFEKTLRVLDHPPNRLSIVPSFTKDDTNRLSFQASYQPYGEEEYPPVITSADQTLKDHYLNANDILETTKIQLESISRHSSIEIYRTDIRPSSFEDFADHYLKTVSLVWETHDASYNDIYFYDKVKSNKKYYYLFRSTNQLGMTGYFDHILEAELINDGGYKYAVFNTIFQTDLKQDSFIQTATRAKKLFQLTPAVQQVALNTENVDYANTALEEYDNVLVGQAEDSLWDQTFKIRLTSKKTNKKIDLNISYHQTDSIE